MNEVDKYRICLLLLRSLNIRYSQLDAINFEVTGNTENDTFEVKVNDLYETMRQEFIDSHYGADTDVIGKLKETFEGIRCRDWNARKAFGYFVRTHYQK